MKSHWKLPNVCRVENLKELSFWDLCRGFFYFRNEYSDHFVAVHDDHIKSINCAKKAWDHTKALCHLCMHWKLFYTVRLEKKETWILNF